MIYSRLDWYLMNSTTIVNVCCAMYRIHNIFRIKPLELYYDQSSKKFNIKKHRLIEYIASHRA